VTPGPSRTPEGQRLRILEAVSAAPFVVLLPACVSAGARVVGRHDRGANGDEQVSLDVAPLGRPHEIFVTERVGTLPGWNFDSWESVMVADVEVRRSESPRLEWGLRSALYLQQDGTHVVAFTKADYGADQLTSLIVPMTQL
jgi:hypothetical protein